MLKGTADGSKRAKRLVCNNCGSANLENIDGQETCADCGMVIAAKQVVLESQDMREGEIVNLRRARIKPKGGSSRKSKFADDDDEEAEILMLNHDQCMNIFERICDSVVALGFGDIDRNRARLDYETFIVERMNQSGYKLLEAVFGSIFARSNEPSLTAWDLVHFATSGLVPSLEFGGLERGPTREAIYAIRNKIENPMPVDHKIVAFRFAYRFAKFIGMHPLAVWRSTWTLLFGLGGWEGKTRLDAVPIAAGVAASVVMLEGWLDQVMKVDDTETICFSPVGTYLPFPMTMVDQMETSTSLRDHHYLRQDAVVSSFAAEDKGIFDSDMKNFFERRLPTQKTRLIGLPNQLCDGKCLDPVLSGVKKLNSVARFASLRDIEIWMLPMDRAFPGNLHRGLSILTQIANRGIDKDLSRKAGSGAGLVRGEIRSIVTEAMKLKPAESIDVFFEDTSKIVGLGCQKVFCCSRVVHPS